MIGLDTNVLLRFLVRDDSSQAERASTFIRENCTPESPGFINQVVLCELVWVLQTAYEYRRPVIVDTIDAICRSSHFSVEGVDTVRVVLQAYSGARADFADCLIALTNQHAGCQTTATFDRAASMLPGFTAL